MDTNLEKDSVARNRIVSETDRNFFVEAGAGSGKTTMLVSRMVAMVEQGKDIGKICAITFTKAAAGEFYERFQRLLIERSNPDYEWKDNGHAGQLPEPTEETRKRCADALQNIDLCFMGTIDSFCGMILSEHPFEAEIPSDATLVTDLDAQMLYKQLYVKICAGEYGEKLQKLARMFNRFYRDPEEAFVTAMSLFMDNRNVNFHFTQTTLEALDLDHMFAAEKSALLKAVACIAEHPEIISMTRNEDEELQEKILDIARAFQRTGGSWNRNCAAVMKAMKDLQGIRLIEGADTRYPNELSGQCVPNPKRGNWLYLKAFQSGGVYEQLRDLQYQISMTFLHRCVPVIESEMRQRGNLTYFDYLFYLRNLLKKDAENGGKLIRYIYDRHSYFLIDEFQDTNPMQAEVFFYLASENPVSRWSDCVPRQGSLFIVGDPKQSIYRFRSADVASFLKVKRLFETTGGEVLYLSRNFRSTKQMCVYFNTVFSALLSKETANQSKFEEIPLPDEETEEFQGAFSYKAISVKNALKHPEQAEMADPVRIGKIITRLVHNPAYTITAAEEKTPRRIRYSDFMVITYGKRSLAPIMAELDKLEIPYKVEGKVPFEENGALKEVAKIYQCMADPFDDRAVYGALLGKFIGLLQKDLIAYKANKGELKLIYKEKPDEASDEGSNEASKEVFRLVAEQVNRLCALSRKALNLSPSALFSEIMEEFRIFEYVPAENLEVLYYTLELLRNAEKAGAVVSLKDGADYIGKLLDGEAEEERCLSLNEARDCVHLANLHKVKGLEAPIVILSESFNRSGSSSVRVTHLDSGAEGYVFKVSKDLDEERSITLFETMDFEKEKEAEKEDLAAERDRLLYVAATRARNALIICYSDRTRWKPLMGKGLPDLFDNTEENTEEMVVTSDEVKATELYAAAAQECVLKERSNEASTYQVKKPSQIRTPSKLAEADVEEADVEEAEGKAEETPGEAVPAIHRFPDLLGTMIHKLMEMLVTSKNSVDAAGAIDEIIREYRTPRSQSCEAQMAEALNKVADCVRNGGYEQENGAPKDILNLLLSAEEVHCEVPFCYREESGDETNIWNGIMDVLYKKDGKWHIIDYKTNLDGAGLDKKYQSQMQAYIDALKATTGEEADALIYHITV